MFKRILVTFDGSDHALETAKIAAQFFSMTQADIGVVIAVDP